MSLFSDLVPDSLKGPQEDKTFNWGEVLSGLPEAGPEYSGPRAPGYYDWDPYETFRSFDTDPGEFYGPNFETSGGYSPSNYEPPSTMYASQEEEDERKKKEQPDFFSSLGNAAKDALSKQKLAGLPVGQALTDLLFGPSKDAAQGKPNFGDKNNNWGTAISGPLGSDYKGIDSLVTITNPYKDQGYIPLENADPKSWLEEIQSGKDYSYRTFSDFDPQATIDARTKDAPQRSIPESVWDFISRNTGIGAKINKQVMDAFLGGGGETETTTSGAGGDTAMLAAMIAGVSKPSPNETPEQKKRRLQLQALLAPEIAKLGFRPVEPKRASKPDTDPMPAKLFLPKEPSRWS